jgi:alpha-amylase
MKQTRNLLLITLSVLLFSSCTTTRKVVTMAPASDNAIINGHPAWINQGNIYEVNVRQYTPEGTFKAFEGHLQRLKEMGVQTLWFMPINPISVKDRKGALGSYYAISNYTAINPEYGTIEDWKELVNKAHSMGFKVMIDWVPNHTGADHPWLTTHTNFYQIDPKTNQPLVPFDWTDVRQLNFKNREMQDSMIASMKFWVTESGIDGFRCDHIEQFQSEFWARCIPELKKQKNLLMLAEAEAPWLYTVGFDMDYGWRLFHTMVDVARGKRSALAIDSALMARNTTFSSNALQLAFTSNHDENSWNKADYGTMPGASHAPFAVLTQTLPQEVPLIYSGQEEPILDSVSFFYKDPMHFDKLQRAPFYKTLLELRKRNPALGANASFRKLRTSDDRNIYAFERSILDRQVLVIVNLSGQRQDFSWIDMPSTGVWKSVFTTKQESMEARFVLNGWDYFVYEK